MEQKPSQAAESNGIRPTDELVAEVYDQLRRVAGRLMADERGRGAGHTFQPTALVHEVWLRLGDGDYRWNDRTHFLRTAAQAMRRLLVDSARARNAAKRGGNGRRVHAELEHLDVAVPEPDFDLVALDAALDHLEAMDARKADIVRLRFFAGLTIEETAIALGIGRTTVKDEWTHARLWLLREMLGSTGAIE
ncbi:MAG: ECF-type sigma factor [Phycisphaerales bacterium]